MLSQDEVRLRMLECETSDMITSNGLLIARISQKDVRSHDVIPEKSIEPNVEKMRESLKKFKKD